MEAKYTESDLVFLCTPFYLQDIVKALFADKAFNAKHRLGAVNSINWARILAQTVYYFLSYFHFLRQNASANTSANANSSSTSPSSSLPENVDLQYVVPTGNFGDILAGYYAKRMGLPIGKLVVATNENDILAKIGRAHV